MTRSLVITTIQAPTEGVRRCAAVAGWQLIVVGDRKTPAGWSLPGVRFLSLDEQGRMESRLAGLLPVDHYARKNLGYLLAFEAGAATVAETDDDNLPLESFLAATEETCEARLVLTAGWANVYEPFADRFIWPRGFPLDRLAAGRAAPLELADAAPHRCPIQQFLADGDPDVDAVYRLTAPQPLDVRFSAPHDLALAPGSFAPFNSQNTVWWRDAYAYLYLPSHVSFRMTDIWRAFVAQRCLAETAPDARIAFRRPTVYQDRNDHSLLRDFRDEVPGYLGNAEIVELLWSLDLAGKGPAGCLLACYEALAASGHVPEAELELVGAWLDDAEARLGG